jgi:hypothetical protein
VNEDQRKHLEFTQQIIARMGNNSFALKGWSVTVLAALFALAADRANRTILGVAVLPVVLFWLLDAYFLAQERVYRRLYDALRTLSSKQWEELGGNRYSLKPQDYGLDPESIFLKVMWRPTLVGLYVALLVSLVLFAILMHKFRTAG